jgi:virulence-associated protein VagC
MRHKVENFTGIPEDSMGFLKTEGELRYNEPFRVVGVQIIDIDDRIIGAWRIELLDEKGNYILYPVVKSFGHWAKLVKEKISDDYVKCLKSLKKDMLVKDVVRFIIQYPLGGPEIVVR